jgi:hypothetical protein
MKGVSMEEKYRQTSLVGPSVLIGVGIILLLDNLGYLEWDVWQLVRLWPVFLIVWGIEILLQGRVLGRILTVFVILAGIIGGVWLMAAGADPRVTTQITYPRNDASSLVLSLQPKVGRLTLEAYKDSANLIGGVVSVPRGVRLVENFSAGNRARLQLDTNPSSRRWWPGQSEVWDLKLDGESLLDIVVDQGIGDIDLDLTRLRLNQVIANFGIATAKITLPSEGNYDIKLDGGIGTILLEIPHNAAVNITVDGGIVTKTFPSTYRRVDNVWKSPEFENQDALININLSLGIGTIVVRQVASQ